ncbi:hypothetical protein JG559_04505 [Enterococcus faecalis]|uniref:Uncharacterized protein n=1 Tax=Enterococcus faecalis TaxID=1351 RepID=A0A974NZ65_ENTFL|nr:hypothetical protein JG559_04505 [Enterococcus faecalis]
MLPFKKIKEESNLTVISITHDIDEAANANRIFSDAPRTIDKRRNTRKDFFLQEKRLLKWAWIYRFLKKIKK